MKLHSFNELCNTDFHINYLAVFGTAEKAIRTYRCLPDQRRFDRFYYIDRGEYIITEDELEPIHVFPNDILYLPSGCAYTSEWLTDEISYLSVEFILDDGEPFSLSDKIFRIMQDSNGIAGEMMRRMLGIWTKGAVGCKLKTTSIFYELLHCIALENLKTALTRSHENISEAILYLENNYTTDVSAADLARLCHMSESSFRRQFTEYAGMPPIRYRNFLRIKQAAELLSAGDYTVGEAADLVGIPDIAYFNKLFNMFMGSNPSSMRK